LSDMACLPKANFADVAKAIVAAADLVTASWDLAWRCQPSPPTLRDA
jgi:hypothetical protein